MKVIPGEREYGLFYPEPYEWDWVECLGVALSIAGALSLAYGRGCDDTYRWAQEYYIGY